ncbi:hypothetical protein KEM63_03335 [Halopseudomonas nanhaiensis]|uniref:PilX N-terminal domain-containing pilus assembly protein n=1 Tax=Halopseudomonas nanhaiensis TaxID=2830842 RepID=UPI001CC0BC39|nr:PilX N-terminal domain-containing pilus assembly protein [Halopseudomonas nanhaiensis]UAW99022.1 hypothetical protein KEM63_03335 [Halopseudomonas nanhaiensis]
MKSSLIGIRQAGSVLVVCLVVLLALTFIGVAGMNNSVMQERIVGGARDQAVAFQAAEAALRVGEERADAIITDIASYATLKPADAVSCDMTNADWVAPAELKKVPPTPTCTVVSYYADVSASKQAQGDVLDPPEICIESGEAAGTGGYSACQQESPRGLLFEVEAEGYGSRGAKASLRSTYLVIKDIE